MRSYYVEFLWAEAPLIHISPHSLNDIDKSPFSFTGPLAPLSFSMLTILFVCCVEAQLLL